MLVLMRSFFPQAGSLLSAACCRHGRSLGSLLNSRPPLLAVLSAMRGCLGCQLGLLASCSATASASSSSGSVSSGRCDGGSSAGCAAGVVLEAACCDNGGVVLIAPTGVVLIPRPGVADTGVPKGRNAAGVGGTCSATIGAARSHSSLT